MFMISNAVRLQGVLSHELGYWGAYSISSSTNNHKKLESPMEEFNTVVKR